jgi:septum formation protein
LITEIILASASPRREQLLKQIGVSFRVIPSEADETNAAALKPGEYVKQCALAKAKSVSAQVNPDDIVIGADTVVVLAETMFGKPAGAMDAAQMLQKLSGRTHSVWSGLAVLAPQRNFVIAVETKVTLAELSAQQIERYVASGEPFDKAGAYAIQGLGSVFVKRIDGCFYNVVGLPLQVLSGQLNELGILLP